MTWKEKWKFECLNYKNLNFLVKAFLIYISKFVKKINFFHCHITIYFTIYILIFASEYHDEMLQMFKLFKVFSRTQLKKIRLILLRFYSMTQKSAIKITFLWLFKWNTLLPKNRSFFNSSSFRKPKVATLGHIS